MNTVRVLSGIQATGTSSHLGTWLGAVRQYVALQDAGHECFYFVADLHALTVPHDPGALRTRTRGVVAEMLALGVDPERSTLFAQSHVAAHTELTWVLECLTGYGEAGRMTQFKDKSGAAGGASVGLFTYPVLQAADILLYQPERVPVGDDQRQHLELTRNLAQRFNSRFGPAFIVPEAFVPAGSARVMDLQDPTVKMSKSLGPAGTLRLDDPPDMLRRKVMRATTDSGSEVRPGAEKPGVTNLLALYAGLSGRSAEQLVGEYAGSGYGAFKADLAEVVVAFVEPVQRRLAELAGDPARVDAVLAGGAGRAREVAGETLATVRELVGLLPAAGRTGHAG